MIIVPPEVRRRRMENIRKYSQFRLPRNSYERIPIKEGPVRFLTMMLELCPTSFRNWSGARPGATCLNQAVIPANPVWARGRVVE